MPRTDQSLHQFIQAETASTGLLKRACVKCGNWIMDRSRSKFCNEHRKQTNSKASANDFTRGYYCAVSALLREHGGASTDVRSLFEQGGGVEYADPEDSALFREHGLME